MGSGWWSLSICQREGGCQGYPTEDLIEDYHPHHLTRAILREEYTYEVTLTSLSLCYRPSRKYNHHFTLRRRKVLGFYYSHFVLFITFMFLLNVSFQRKVHIYLCFFFLLSECVVSSKGKWKSCHLHASPDINNSLSMFTTYIRWHCYSWWFYYRHICREKKCLAQPSLIAWFCINYVSYREFELVFTKFIISLKIRWSCLICLKPSLKIGALEKQRLPFDLLEFISVIKTLAFT